MNIELIIENAQLKGRVIALDAEVKCLEAVIRSHERVDCLTVTSLKAEVARLNSLIANSEHENARLKAEAENARLKAEVADLKSTADRFKAEVESLMTNPTSRLLRAEREENARLKAEVERLESDIKMEKENEDRLVREWQKANNEVYGLQTQVAALIDDQTRLKSEVERLTKAGDAIYQSFDQFVQVDATTLKGWLAAKGVQS